MCYWFKKRSPQCNYLWSSVISECTVKTCLHFLTETVFMTVTIDVFSHSCSAFSWISVIQTVWWNVKNLFCKERCILLGKMQFGVAFLNNFRRLLFQCAFRTIMEFKANYCIKHKTTLAIDEICSWIYFSAVMLFYLFSFNHFSVQQLYLFAEIRCRILFFKLCLLIFLY